MVGTIVFDKYGIAINGRAVRYDVDDSAPIYIGTNESADSLESCADWLIWKFSYTTGKVTRAEARAGSWTGRAALPWTF